MSDTSGRGEVYVSPFPDLDGTVVVSSNGGGEPVWSPSGDELFFRNGFEMFSLSFAGASDIPTDRPTSLFVAPYTLPGSSGAPSPNYDVAADGRFIMVGQTGPTGLHVALNWFQELKRLVPTVK